MRYVNIMNVVFAEILLAGLALVGTAWAEGAAPAEPRASAAEPAQVRSADRASSAFLLPDEGPRYDVAAQGPDAKQFDELLAAVAQHDYEVASAGLDAFATLNPDSAFLPAVLALRADTMVLRDPTNRKRADAINQYRILMRDYPKTANAVRAAWRIGDLYGAMGWLEEAKAAYEQVVSTTPPSYDADRALLGLAMTWGAMGKWSEAERGFQQVRARTTHEPLLKEAVKGLAKALTVQHRAQDAHPYYELLQRRWPVVLKQDPDLLYQQCEMLFATNRLLQARDTCSLLYNLYPSSLHAGDAVVRVGDSCQQLSQHKCAQLYYAAGAAQFPGSAAGVTARLRLGGMEQVVAESAGEQRLALKVRGLMRGAADSYLDESSSLQLYETIASDHEGDVLGSEALFRLAEYYELRKESDKALRAYQDVTKRSGLAERDPWPQAAGERLAGLLRPKLEEALRRHDDFEIVSFFHAHGQKPEQHYAGMDVLLRIAEALRRTGFLGQAVHVYQSLVRDVKAPGLHEEALIGLGEAYLEQRDYGAAQKVFERQRFLYPLSQKSTKVSLLLAGSLLQQGNRAGAVRLATHWLKSHPKDPARSRIQQVQARALLEEGKIDEAVQLFDESAKGGAPLGNDELLRLADAFTARDQAAKSLPLYQRVLASKPNAEQEDWARFQVMRLQAGARKKDRSNGAAAPSAALRDPLLQRAEAVIRTNVRVAAEKEED